jgi:hypothetical protein
LRYPAKIVSLRINSSPSTSVFSSTPGHRRTDSAEAEAARPVHGRRGCALGQAPALEDQDVQRVEELSDFLRERSSARDPDAQSATEALLHLRVDEPVGQSVLER